MTDDSQPHEAENVPIKWAEIDKKILPLVRWMNGLPGVVTRHCCEGDPGDMMEVMNAGKVYHSPYVAWHCEDILSVSRILASFERFDHGIETIVRFNDSGGGLVYRTGFPSQDVMLGVSNHLVSIDSRGL